jgi:uncharacterized glyoxalase superfamily protein PhnB
MLKEAIPILDVHDVEKALRFYVDRLGFETESRDEDHPANYAGVRRGEVSFYMQWQHEDAFRDGTAGPLRVRILVDDPDALFDEYQAMSLIDENAKVRDTDWGTREFGLRDLDGNGLIFFCDRP